MLKSKKIEVEEEQQVLTEEEKDRVEFEEYKRNRKNAEIAKLLNKIDHTLLKQTATKQDLKRLCDEAIKYGFYSVCVHPAHVSEVCSYLGKSAVNVACVVGFPMGENTTECKVFETKRAVAQGADEIDMVISISAIKNGNWSYVKKEIKKVVSAAKKNPVKVILENSLLTQEEIIKACKVAVDAGAAFVKTSTGYFGDGAKVEDVRLMKDTVNGKCSVKASGGIRSGEDFKKMIDAGADRIGTSAGVKIAEDLQSDF